MIRPFLFLIWLSVFASHAAATEDPLDPEQAFRFSVRALGDNTIEAKWTIQNGYYMYRDKFQFSVSKGKLGAPVFPPGKVKDDETFGRVVVYRNEVRVRLPFEGTGTLILSTTAQGCWDGGICYPPFTQKAQMVVTSASSEPILQGTDVSANASATSEVSATSGTPASVQQEDVVIEESGQIAQLLESGNWSIVVASFLGFGLLLSLTPCVFPMIPILSGIIVSHGHAVTKARSFLLSVAYVLGMAITYTSVGIAAGYSGTLLTNALQNAWVLGGFGLVFVALSLSMFGFYELQMPAVLQSRLSQSANRQAGSIPAIAAMGAMSALIVGPCVAAPLAGALLYIAKTGNAVLGGVALFSMAIGMGIPLVLVGMFSRSMLPKSGAWMEGVKRLFGVVMLGTALWLVAPVVPTWLLMAMIALLLILSGVYLHALDPLPRDVSGVQRMVKGIGVSMVIVGTAYLLGALGGSHDPLQPLSFLKNSYAAPVQTEALTKLPVSTVDELDRRLAEAATRKQPVMLDFFAEWCVSCKEMERFTFANPAVKKALDGFLILQADVTVNSLADKELLKRFGLYGPPGVIFFDKAGRERASIRVIGFQDAEKFRATLARIPP